MKDLQGTDGLWQYNFADVDRIVLDNATLLRNATWNTSAQGTTGTVFFTADSGLLRPVSNVVNSFQGRLLGTGANAGSEANGVWSLGTMGNSTYLAGGFGVMHSRDISKPSQGGGDDGSTVNSQLISTSATPILAAGEGATLADGMLSIKLPTYGWNPDDSNPPVYSYGVRTSDDGSNVTFTAAFDLKTLKEKANGATTDVKEPKHVTGVIAELEKQRDQLQALQGLTHLCHPYLQVSYNQLVAASRFGVWHYIP